MLVFARTNNSELHPVKVVASMTVKELKEAVAEVTLVPPPMQKLVLDGEDSEFDAAIDEHADIGSTLLCAEDTLNVQYSERFHACVRLMAGGVYPSPDVLLLSAFAGRTAEVQDLLATGLSPDTRSPEGGETLLINAARMGHLDTAQALLSMGADPDLADLMGRTPMHYAVAELHCWHKQSRILACLMDYGADPDIEDSNGHTPLSLAVAKGNTASAGVIAARLSTNAWYTSNTNNEKKKKSRWHALSGAVALGVDGLETLSGLLTMKYGSVGVRDYLGRTLLHKAQLPEVVGVLLAQGVDINSLDDQWKSPLVAAIEAGNETLAGFLLSRGASPDPSSPFFSTRPVDGTALHRAVMSANLKLVRLLLAAGASPNTHDGSGRSSFDVCPAASTISSLLSQHAHVPPAPQKV